MTNTFISNKSSCVIALFFIFSSISFGQPDHPCAHSKLTSLVQSRSATLSTHYINLTAEYNVHFYKLDLAIERTSIRVAGTGEIHAVCEVALLDTFLFELEENLAISEIRLNGITPVTYTRNGSAVIIETSFGMGDSFYYAIDYSGAANPGGGGPFGDAGMMNRTQTGNSSQYTFSISVPFYAYEWFPCKQSLRDKADSSCVFITSDETNLAGSNGLLSSVIDLPGNKKRFEWKSRNPIVYYLISVSIGEYVEHVVQANLAGVAETVPVQSYFYDIPDQQVLYEQAAYETVRYLEYFSELLGGYPFDNEKYGYTMAPIGGGMEHQTMTTMGSFTNRLISHELGHQWFGNHVTCASWADMWLKEGLTSYMEDLALEKFYPSESEAYMTNRHNFIMSRLRGSVHVEDTLDLSDIYDSRITYTKGPAILHTLRFIINDDNTFFEVLQNYLNIKGGGHAYTNDFKEILETTTGEDYTPFFEQWYFGEGFPIYSIEYEQFGSIVNLELVQKNVFDQGIRLFTNDLEIIINGSSSSEVIRLENINEATTSHSFDFAEPITSIEIDPNYWIINRSGPIEGVSIFAGIKESTEQNLLLFPNPVKGNELYLKVNESTEYKIINMQGELVKEGLLKTNNHIDIEDLSGGKYFLKVNEKNYTFIKR